MKKLFFLSIMAMMALSINAQDVKDCKTKDCKAQMEARAGKWAERFAMDDAKKSEFTKLYVEYLTALKEAMPQCEQGACEQGKKECKQEGQCEKGKKECKQGKKECKQATLTDAQANEMLQARFDREAKRIEASKQCLEVNKRFAPKFQKILTPQQTLKVMCNGGKHGKGQAFGHGKKHGKKHGGMQGCDNRVPSQAHMPHRMQRDAKMHGGCAKAAMAADSLGVCRQRHAHGEQAK